MIRVLIADDQAIVRAGLTVVLEAETDLTVVGQAADGYEAARLAAELQPDVVCMDIRMPGRDGIQATRDIVAEHPHIGVLVVTTFDLDDYVFGALEAGAAGFLLKGSDETTITQAIRSVAAGDGTLDQRLTRRVLTEFAQRRPAPEAQRTNIAEHLTPREIEILVLLSQGHSNKEIAAQLFIEPTTVKYHLASLLTKTGTRDRLQVALWALRSGIVQ
ncbi:DNA-binding NarL/FixJ family response regulator [Leucobacter exalbidus]|uniref:DNA-binding NarL/FixJ family response regulator n=1 Tax=Leucobacter exalbidus TaxID=662960 RepID=A0A940T643_9MICO|nr:response regulator transcription factor [Leucobacter exalbidus]MBP1326611.1 DNA-binding NarL/FixJ family response regulator [Leucobacter exalbidus]